MRRRRRGTSDTISTTVSLIGARVDEPAEGPCGAAADHALDIVFSRRDGGRFLLGADAGSVVHAHLQRDATHPEAGGVLLGRHLLGCDDIIVDTATAPLPGDRQSRFRFFRARAPHQAAIDRAWRESLGTQTYLGEWHTHPEPTPTPSSTDCDGWRRKLRTDRYTDVLFFLIAGTATIRAWEGTRDGGLHLMQPLTIPTMTATGTERRGEPRAQSDS